MLGEEEKEVKGGREEAGTEWLLFTLLFMMFSTIFCRDLPCGNGGGLLTVFKGILQNNKYFLPVTPKYFLSPPAGGDRFVGLHTIHAAVTV